MHRVGFEPTIPVFELAKTFHALDSAASVIGSIDILCSYYSIVSRIVAWFVHEYRALLWR
jgi:hypothetical protein